MLSIPGQKIPRKISIKVAKAEKLKETKKEGKNKICNKFKVHILGGKNKESSPTVMSSNGNVQWLFSCMIKLHKTQNDPLVLLVEDSDGNHKGQVIIPIVKIPNKPYTYNASQEPSNSTNILCSELEPTNKCSNPSGFLLYWVWVEEYFTEEQLGKRSFNKSMGSLFGSKSKLGSSKTNLEIKNRESLGTFGSHSNLNKPEKHKKSSSFLNLKIGGKKKSKPSSSDCKITPDSSDVESSSNFSFNPAHPSNPFENDPDLVKTDRVSIKNGSLAEDDSLSRKFNKYSNDSYNFNKSDITYNGNRDNLSEAQFSIKSGDKNILSAFESVSKVEKASRQSIEEINNGKTLLMMALTANKKVPTEDIVKATNPFGDGMAPTVVPPYTNQNLVSSSKNSSKQNNGNLSSSTLPNKYNTMKDLQTYKEPPFNIDSSIAFSNETESTYRPGHNKSGVGSDYSIFSQYSNPFPVQSITKVKENINQRRGERENLVNNDESESIKRENSELKQLNSRLGQQINDLTFELDSVKQTLCKLRLKLLDEGATQFLEI